MLLNVASARIPPALSLLLWCALGNLLLLILAVCAFLLRRQPAAAGLIRFAADHPWRLAAAALPLLCLGAVVVYRDYPLSMDEYAPVFQAQAFAAGRLGGQFPPELLEQLLPRFAPTHFFSASRTTGEVSAGYWPGFALLLTPFAWLGVPWAANPVISALTLPAVHRLTREISGSRETAGLAGAAYSLDLWRLAAFGALSPEVTLRFVAPSATAMIVGLQLIFSSFFLGVLGLRRK